MTASITDRTRVTGTIACSGAVAANAITSAVLRTALGFPSTEPCVIGSSDGYYTQFGFRVDTTGGRTWDFAVDDIGDGTYTALKTGIASGANVVIGLIPGAFSDGTAVGSRRPFSFQVTLSSADADSVISFAAVRILPNDARMVAADLTSTNTAIAAISTLLGTPVGASVSADALANYTALNGMVQSNEFVSVAETADAIWLSQQSAIIATGTLDGAFSHTDTVIECSTLSGTVDYYGSGCRVVIANSADSNKKAVRAIGSYSTANKRLTLSAALPWTPVNGDTFVVIPA